MVAGFLFASGGRGLVPGLSSFDRGRRLLPWTVSEGHCQVSNPDQVVSRQVHGSYCLDELQTSVMHFPQAANRLAPSEDLLNQFPLPLADVVAIMPQCPLVN